MPEEIDIILTTHNHLELTIPCLATLYEHTKVPFKLTVVDDSTDLTPQYLEQFHQEHPNMSVIRPEKPFISANQAVNIALKNTSNELIVFITSTTTVEPNWLDWALKLIENEKNVGIVGFKLLFPNGMIEHAGLTWDAQAVLNYGMGSSGHTHTWIKEVNAVGWALVLLRREAIPEFEEDYYIGFRGWDDLDNCLQIRKRGWKVVYCGFGSAYHKARATTRTKEYIEGWAENRKRFIKRWGIPLRDILENLNMADAQAIERLLTRIKAESPIVVEIGSWAGFSTSVIATWCRRNNGIVFAVDHWRGREGTWNEKVTTVEDVYSIFRVNLQAFGLWDYVKPMVMDSQTACPRFQDNSVDMVFIDADHRYDAIKWDIENWLPKLKEGGIICGHDCEGFYSQYDTEKQKLIDEHKNEDWTEQIHCGVVKALYDILEDKYQIMPSSIIWYYIKGGE